jgi:hypothetical protein
MRPVSRVECSRVRSSSPVGAAATPDATGKSSPRGASSSGSASAGRGASVPGERQGRPTSRGNGKGGRRGKSRSSTPPPREQCKQGEDWLTEQSVKTSSLEIVPRSTVGLAVVRGSTVLLSRQATAPTFIRRLRLKVFSVVLVKVP